MFFSKKKSKKYNQVTMKKFPNSLCGVQINNLSLDEYCFVKLNDTIKCFLKNGDVFFGFYRVDGLYLTREEFENCSIDIPQFFTKNGEYREIIEEIPTKKGKSKFYNFLTVARTTSNEELFNELRWIFKYYLETTFFSPNISFNEFFDIHSNYMHKSSNVYLLNGYTDFVFYFYDSEHFDVVFDPQKQDSELVYDTIKNIWDQSDGGVNKPI